MYRALYRTWRPQTFDDVCGQTQITDILKYQVSEGKTSHAYLFCGSRGTGKTTCAKILAKAVNCLHPVHGNPCNACEACRAIDAGTATDVIEMDAASNNGVDHVRDLKEEIVFMPAELKYRVYIIDEVHMMSSGAFNALLKTLEEPPGYVLFILATTELNKLPSTIVSRCQRCDFRRIPTDVIMGRLTQIAGAEGMDLTEGGARMIARAAQGGMRDAVSLLELCGGAHAPIDEALVTQVLGAGDRSTLWRVAEAIADKNYETIYQTVQEIVMSSGDLAGFWSGLGDVFRDMIVLKTLSDGKEYLDLTDSETARLTTIAAKLPLSRLFYLSKIITDTLPSLQKTGISRRATVEIALTRMCDPRLSASPEAMLARLEDAEREIQLLRMGASTPAAQPRDASAIQPPDVVKAPATLSDETPRPRTPDAAPRGKTPETPPAKPQSSAPAQAQSDAGSIGIALKNWHTVAEEFGRLFPGYRALLEDSRAEVKDGVLYLFLRDHILLGNLGRDANVARALTSLASREQGSEIKAVQIVKVGGAQRAPRTDDTFF
jgi:DNA polymerase-3 subunit gamma/tau